MTRRQMTCLVALACAVGGFAVPASGANDLMILVEKSRAPDSTFVYDFGFSLARDAATSCSLTVGPQTSQTYSCSQVDDGWLPEARFWVENNSLTKDKLQTLLAEDWVITWNGESSPTIAVVKFDSTWIDNFPPLPTITGLEDNGDSTGIIRWNPNPGPPGSVDIEYFGVDVVDLDWETQVFNATECKFALPCEGVHTARVAKVHMRIGNVSEDVVIQQGNWDLEPGGGWFQYWCFDQRLFGVRECVSTQKMSWSRLKALYR